MADTKITALTAISTVDPAIDVLPIVDVSDTTMAASGTTKKITSNQILGSGGTATLASATITGDLTVDTSTLKVNSSTNRVGVNTASPQTTLDAAGTVTISGGTSNARRLQFDASGVYLNYIESDGTAGAGYIVFAPGNAECYRIATGGTSTWSVGGSTAMTLNSTGLGLGVTPSAWTIKAVQVVNGSIYGAGNETGFYGNAFYGSSGWTYIAAAGASGYLQNAGTHQWFTAAAGAANAAITDFAAAKMTLDASGNLTVANGNVILGTSGKGIDFSATASGSGTMTSELLNDYEEGTWTIGIAFGGASTGITYSQNTGKYTKVGRLVTVFGAVDLTNKGSATGNASITGLPFSIGGASSDYSAASLQLVNITFADFPMGFGNPTTTTIPLQEVTNAGVRTNLTDADFANNSAIIFSLTYSV